jgi:hypothetical protein
MPAIKLLTQTQTPEPITLSVEATAHDRVKFMLTIKRNERSPSREIAAHNQRNAQLVPRALLPNRMMARGFSLSASRVTASDNFVSGISNLKTNRIVSERPCSSAVN